MVIAAAVGMAGCGAPASSDAGADPTSSVAVRTPTVDASPTTPAGTEVPNADTPVQALPSAPRCDELYAFTSDNGMTERTPPLEALSMIPGPVAQQAFTDSVSTNVCSWGIPSSDAGIEAAVAVLDANTSAELVDALSASGSYQQQSRGGVELFAHPLPGGRDSWVGFGFHGPYWVILTAFEADADYALDTAHLFASRLH